MLSAASLAAAVTSARGAAEALRGDTCTVTGPPVVGAWDPVTGREGSEPGPVLYEGRCRVQVPPVQPGTPDAGGHVWSTRTVVVSVPVAAGDVPKGSVVTVTAARMDPALAGRTYRVVAGLAKTAASARRLTCEEVLG